MKIENYLDSIISLNQAIKSNTIIIDEINDKIKSEFPKKFNNGILSDLPFKLDRVTKCNNGKYIVELEYSLTSKYYYNDENRDILRNLEIDIFCTIGETEAKKLIEGEYYLVKDKFKEYLTFENNEKYCAYVLNAPFIGFESGTYENEIQFGAIAIELNDIKHFEEKK